MDKVSQHPSGDWAAQFKRHNSQRELPSSSTIFQSQDYFKIIFYYSTGYLERYHTKYVQFQCQNWYSIFWFWNF